MARQIIDTTTPQPNGKIGDTAKVAFEKTNENFAELYDAVANIPQDITEAIDALDARVTANEGEIAALAADMQEQIDALAAGQAAGQKVYRTWAELSGVTGSAGEGAQVIDDTGTHTDPVVGGTVANAGQYVWNESPAGWRWVRPDALASKVDATVFEEVVQDIRRVTSDNPETESLAEWRDSGGFVAGRIAKDGLELPGMRIAADGHEADGFVSRYGTPDPVVIYRDRFGFWAHVIGDAEFGLTQDGFRNAAGEQRHLGRNDYVIRDRFGFWMFSAREAAAGGGAGGDVSIRDRALIEVNADALAASVAAHEAIPAGIQAPVFDYNIVVVYGQSLSTGYETWPAKSKVNQEPNLLMLGESTRPNNRASSSFVPVGSATLQPLKAVVQSTGTGNPVMSDADVAALPHTSAANNDGEAPEIGAINFWRQLYLQHRWLQADPTRKVVAVNCGVGGQSIARLSKGHASGYYNRITSAVSQVKAIADGEGKTCGVVAILHLQGEYDYTEQNEGVNNKATFKSKTEQFFTDVIADVMSITGQPLKPAIFTYQTGGTYTRDTADLAIGMAQIEMAQNPGVFLASPVYHVTDKGGHLDANGCRWVGVQFGKVMHRVLTQGKGWQPLRPLKAVIVGTEILIGYITPCPPLQFKTVYRGSTPYLPATKGFRVTDAAGEVPIVSVSIAASVTVSIQLARTTTGTVKVWYAPQTTHMGHGNLCDSDDTLSPFVYEYEDGTGDWEVANIPELIGKPYPLNNFAVAHVTSVINI